MTLSGDAVLGLATGPGGRPFHAIDPRTGEQLAPAFGEATAEQVAAVCAGAAAAAPACAAVPATRRAAFLRRIGSELVALGDRLLERTGAETALPPQRLLAERGRTVGQLERFADLVEEGSWVDARIDRALPDRQPVPRPDLRRMLVPLGPVVVFGASNFPLAFSVAGGDTASALAAGCPVVCKGHPAHPGTSELAARAILAAALAAGMPPGTFALVQGPGEAVGAAMVQHPGIAAVGFTGSHGGGRALFDLAGRRPVPIPVFAEMGSVNPVFVLPGALESGAAALAGALAASATLAAGQFCTSPGMAVFLDGPEGDAFVEGLLGKLGAVPAGTTVHAGIAAGFTTALAELQALEGVEVLGPAQAAAGETAPARVRPRLLATTGAAVLRHPRLRREVYGPCVIAVRCRDRAELLAVAAALGGHLTATVHGTEADLLAHRDLLAQLTARVGRVLCNGVPTGVEVCSAMQHGGPYPASTDPRYTSVGTAAILRWARPVCFQDLPQALLPEELRDGNPRGILRTVDGTAGRA